MVGTLLLVVRTSFLEAETFELRLVGASLEKALEKGVLGREKGRVEKRKKRCYLKMFGLDLIKNIE